MKKALIYSLLIHFLVGGMIFLFLKGESRPLIPHLALRGSPQIEIVLDSEAGKGTSQTPGYQQKRLHTRDRKKERAVPQLKDLHLGPLASHEDSGKGSDLSTHSQKREGRGGGGSDGYDLANTIGIEKEGELYSFFSAVWKKIDSSAGYPNDFVQERIEGLVTIHLTVNRKGVFLGQFLKADADSLILKTYVMALLVHALDTPLPQINWADRDEMTLVVQFDFKTFGYGQSPRERGQNHVKNLLYFKRDAYVDPKLNQEIQKVFTKYLPPIIPLPGAFYIDFFRAYQMVKGLSTPDPEELRRNRLQNFKEEWQRVIKRSPESAVQ